MAPALYETRHFRLGAKQRQKHAQSLLCDCHSMFGNAQEIFKNTLISHGTWHENEVLYSFEQKYSFCFMVYTLTRCWLCLDCSLTVVRQRDDDDNHERLKAQRANRKHPKMK